MTLMRSQSFSSPVAVGLPQSLNPLRHTQPAPSVFFHAHAASPPHQSTHNPQRTSSTTGSRSFPPVGHRDRSESHPSARVWPNWRPISALGPSPLFYHVRFLNFSTQDTQTTPPTNSQLPDRPGSHPTPRSHSTRHAFTFRLVLGPSRFKQHPKTTPGRREAFPHVCISTSARNGGRRAPRSTDLRRSQRGQSVARYDSFLLYFTISRQRIIMLTFLWDFNPFPALDYQ